MKTTKPCAWRGKLVADTWILSFMLLNIAKLCLTSLVLDLFVLSCRLLHCHTICQDGTNRPRDGLTPTTVHLDRVLLWKCT